MDFKDKRVLVFGLGKSGTAAARLLLKQGARVAAYDGNASLNEKDIRRNITEGTGGGKDLNVVLGRFDWEILEIPDLAVISPGVPLDLPEISALRKKNVPLWPEIELAYICGKGDVLAVTGTNGKTTTTSLLGEIMKNYKGNTFVAGNIGRPYCETAALADEDSVTVLELSSFQLEGIHAFRPKVSAILNLAPDHLDRHHSFENYIRAKEKIAANQTKEDTCVLNYEDELTRRLSARVSASPFYFSSTRHLEKGIYIEKGSILYDMGEGIEKLIDLSDIRLVGTHNYENVMAAAGMALCYGAPPEVIYKTVAGFNGVEHRIEFVAEKGGVKYYNDSKGTNPSAAIKAIQAMDRPTFLIGGGYDKGASYKEWIEAFGGKVKKLVLIGETKEKIARTARRMGFTDTVCVETFEEAFTICAKNATCGDAVLLSPACASWDMFKNFEERGDKFKELIKRL